MASVQVNAPVEFLSIDTLSAGDFVRRQVQIVREIGQILESGEVVMVLRIRSRDGDCDVQRSGLEGFQLTAAG